MFYSFMYFNIFQTFLTCSYALEGLKDPAFVKTNSFLKAKFVDLQQFLPLCPSCFVSVTNYLGFDILESLIPIILRPNSATSFSNCESVFIKNPKNVSKNSIHCLPKYLFCRKGMSSKLCINKSHILQLNFSSNIRPWTFELDVHLNLPISSKSESEYSTGWKHGLDQEERAVSSIRYKMLLFDQMPTLNGLNFCRKFMTKKNLEVATDIFVVVTLIPNTKNITVLPPCTTCNTTLNTATTLLNSANISSFIEILNYLFANTRNISAWKMLKKTLGNLTKTDFTTTKFHSQNYLLMHQL